MSGLHRGPIISKQTVFIDYTIVIFSKEAIIYEYLNSHYYTLLLLCTILAKYIQMLQNPVKNKESKETHHYYHGNCYLVNDKALNITLSEILYSTFVTWSSQYKIWWSSFTRTVHIMNNFSSFGSFNILCDRAAGKPTSLLVRLQHHYHTIHHTTANSWHNDIMY